TAVHRWSSSSSPPFVRPQNRHCPAYFRGDPPTSSPPPTRSCRVAPRAADMLALAGKQLAARDFAKRPAAGDELLNLRRARPISVQPVAAIDDRPEACTPEIVLRSVEDLRDRCGRGPERQRYRLPFCLIGSCGIPIVTQDDQAVIGAGQALRESA